MLGIKNRIHYTLTTDKVASTAAPIAEVKSKMPRHATQKGLHMTDTESSCKGTRG